MSFATPQIELNIGKKMNLKSFLASSQRSLSSWRSPDKSMGLEDSSRFSKNNSNEKSETSLTDSPLNSNKRTILNRILKRKGSRSSAASTDRPLSSSIHSFESYDDVQSCDGSTDGMIVEKAILGKRALLGRATSEKKTLSLFLDKDKFVCQLEIRPTINIVKARKRIEKEGGGQLFKSFRFCYTDGTPVEIDNEGTTRLQSCLSYQGDIHIYSPRGLVDHSSPEFSPSSKQLSSISDDAEVVVRQCLRLIESFQTDKRTKRAISLSLPSPLASSLLFFRDVVRATLATPSADIRWQVVLRKLQEIEHQLRTILRRPKFIALMSYQSDLVQLSKLIETIQKELKHGRVSDDHPVFNVKMDKPRSDIEDIMFILERTSFLDLCGEHHACTRSKIAQILHMRELDVIDCIKNKGTSASLCGSGMFRDTQQLLVKEASYHSGLDRDLLKEVLAPQIDRQAAWVRTTASSYHPLTCKRTMEAFDKWSIESNGPHRCFLLTGQQASGKSTFACHLAEARSRVVIASHFCRHDDSETTNAKRMILSLVYQLCEHNAMYEKKIRALLVDKKTNRKDLLSKNYPTKVLFREMLEEPLNSINVKNSHCQCIIIDGVELGHEDSDSVLTVLRTHFVALPSWIRLVVTTRPILPVLKRLRVFNANMVQPKTEDTFSDFSAFFYDRLENCSNDAERRMMAEQLANNANGNFLFAKIVDQKIQEGSDKIHSYLSLDLETILRAELCNAEKVSKELFWDIVQMSLVSMHALAKEDIVAFTGCYQKQMDHLLDSSKSFFVLTAGNVIRFTHQTTKNWLLARILAESRDSPVNIHKFFSFSALKAQFENEFKCCHRRFAFQILRVVQICRRATHFSIFNDSIKEYLLKFGCYHMVEGGLEDDALRTTLDPVWIMEKAVDPEGLISDCKLLSERNEVMQLLQRAVVLSLPAIRKDHRQIASQLVGRLKAACLEGHRSIEVQETVQKFVDELESHDFGFQWWCPVAPTWDQAEQTLVRKITCHNDLVQCVQLHPANQVCATASWDTQIRLWNIFTGKRIMELSGHNAAVWCIQWNKLGTKLVSTGADKTIRVWSYPDGLQQLVLIGHTDTVFTAKFSHDSKLVATGSRDGTIRIWSVDTGECLKVMQANDRDFVYSVDWKPHCDNRFLCSGGTDNVVRVWDLKQDGKCSLSCFGHTDWIRSVAWSIDGRSIYSGSADKSVICWDSETAECEQVLMGHKGGVWSVVPSEDARYIFSSSVDGSVKIWECSTWRCDQTLSGHSGPVHSISVASDGSKVMSGGADGSLIEWDCEVERTVSDLDDHTKPVFGVDVSPDRTRILSASTDNTARLWNVATGLAERVFAGHTGPVWKSKFNHAGGKVATASSDGTAAIYRVSTGGRMHELPHGDTVWDVAWSKDDQKLFTAAKDHVIREWCARQGTCQVVFQGHTKDVKSISISNDGKRMASASSDCSLRIWDLVTRKTSKILRRNNDAGAIAVEWCPDNIHVAAGYASGAVRLWNADTGKEAAGFLPGHSRRTNAVSCSPDGKRVVSASTDKEIRIWNRKTEQCEQRITAGIGLGVFTVKYIDNEYIVSGGADRTVRIWSTETGTCKTVMAGVTGLGIYDVAFSPNGRWVASGSRDRTVQIWDSDSGKCVKTFKGHTNWVHSIDWDKSGQRVVSRSDDGSGRLWNVETGECEQVFSNPKILPASFVVGSAPTISADLSQHADDGNPIGIQCEKVKVCGERACGWIGKTVFFFKLRTSNDFEKSLQLSDLDKLVLLGDSSSSGGRRESEGGVTRKRLSISIPAQPLQTTRVVRRRSMISSCA